jgi:hypothetical protein
MFQTPPEGLGEAAEFVDGGRTTIVVLSQLAPASAGENPWETMIVQSPAPPAFESFLAGSAEYWSARLAGSTRGNGFVVVELLHNNATVLMTDLHIARYLAEFMGCDVAAFIAPTFTGYPVPVAEIERLAASFGITKIWHLCAPSPPRSKHDSKESAIRTSFSRILTSLRWRGLNGHRLRQSILGLRIADVPVGDLVYDSFLAFMRTSTIQEVDPLLDRLTVHARAYLREVESVLRSENIRAVVVSQSAYLDYAGILRLALKRAIPVYCKSWLYPICIRRYDSFAEAEEAADTPIQPAIDFCRQTLGEEFSARADAFFPPSQKGGNFLRDLRYGYDSLKRELSGRELHDLLQLDAGKRTCLIMAHQFNDSPHWYGDSLFDDYYQWLVETLKFVATCPHLNWLVREHPYEVALGEVDDFNALISQYAHVPNIKLVPQTVTTSSLFACVDAITTVAGSGGLEFASAGVPPINAGNPFYGDLGFAIRPRTVDEYFKCLESIQTLPRLNSRQIQQAKEAALVHFECKRVASGRLPPTMDLADQQVSQADLDAYWVAARRNAVEVPIETDALYRNLKVMFSRNEKTLLNFAWSGTRVAPMAEID